MTPKEYYELGIELAKEFGLSELRAVLKKLNKVKSLEPIQKRKAIPKTWIKEKLTKSNKCKRCGRFLTEQTATGDHIEAHNLGGEHSKDNLRLLCGPCNSSKSDGTMLEESKKLGKTIAEML